MRTSNSVPPSLLSANHYDNSVLSFPTPRGSTRNTCAKQYTHDLATLSQLGAQSILSDSEDLGDPGLKVKEQGVKPQHISADVKERPDLECECPDENRLLID